MKIKSSVAVLAALYAAGIGAAVQTAPIFPAAKPFSVANQPISIKAVAVQKKSAKSFVRKQLSSKIKIEQGLTGTSNYIVRLKDQAAASYDGHLAPYKATNPQVIKKIGVKGIAKNLNPVQKKQSLKLNAKSPEVKSYVNYLDNKQQDFLSKARSEIGTNLVVNRTFKYAINGLSVKMTQEQAIKVASMRDVAFVEREEIKQLNTDQGPVLIGAPNVWDGTATGTVHQGEGVIIGMIDTGINTDNPSFADIGGDGYDHTNPYGAGSYVGDCAADFPGLCNDKLIGVHHYGWVTDVYADTDVFGDTPPAANGEDYNGHGSHTASTAGGNVLLNVDMLDSEPLPDSDGVNTTGFKFDRISGVAPHANIIAYQVCRPGNSGDAYSGCSGGGSTVAAIDDAIREGVDVLNYSIGGSSDINPWQNAEEQAFLSANAAGIFVATSAGNSGPDAHTAFKPSPWYAAVAASTHGRSISFDLEFGGDIFNYAKSDGPALDAPLTAPIKYSGTIDASNFEGCNAFQPAVFENSLALISRGSCSFAQKITNAADAGALAVVVFNNTGGDTPIAMGGTDSTTIPSVGISQNSGAAMVASLETAPDTEVTINTVPTKVIGQADDLAAFSSRGPTNFPDIIVPSVAAPGVSIYAAYSDQQRGHDVSGNGPADFAFLSGTSMAGPHVAGSGALVKSAHPDWTADNIRSALMMTATTEVRKEDGQTPADALDVGAGRVRVDLAVKSGLVMDETFANYQAANPAMGGDPTTLNIASLGNGECPAICTWERTFTATVDGEWTTSGFANTAGLVVSVEPSTFTLTAGQSQTVTVTANMPGFATGESAFGGIKLTPSSDAIPEAHLPLYVVAKTSTIPTEFQAEIHRNAGSTLIPNVTALAISDFTALTHGLNKAVSSSLSSPMDSDNSTPYDDLTDGVTVSWLNVTSPSLALLVELANSTAPDLDLRVGLDDGDGIPQEDEEICVAATAEANERCLVNDVEPGNYWVVVQNWQSSGDGAVDTYDLLTGFASEQSQGNFSVTAQNSSINEDTPFNLRLQWNADMEAGDVFLGAFDSSSSASTPGDLGSTLVILRRGADDVSLSSDMTEAVVGDKVNFTIDIALNESMEDLDYVVKSTMPAGIKIDSSTVQASSGTVTLDQNGFIWSGQQVAIFGPNVINSYQISNNDNDASCSLPDFGQGGGYIDLALFGIGLSSVDGDTTTGTFGVSGTFLGTTYDAITVTDDGFAFFSGSAGGAPWVNQLLPDAEAPNNLVAPFWRDMFFDTAAGSGMSVATAGPFTFMEWDKMHHWAFAAGQTFVDDILDFEVVFDNATGQIMYAYDNVAHNFADQLGGTVGFENADGNDGITEIYANPNTGLAEIGSVTDIHSGLVICHTPVNNTSPAEITFTGTITNLAAGDNVSPLVTSSTNNLGSTSADTVTNIHVASNLTLNSIGNTTIAEDTVFSGALEITDNDSVANTITVTADSGTVSDIVDGAFTVTPDTNFNGDIAVSVVVTDNEKPADSVSTNFVITVTPVNDVPTITAGSTVTVKEGEAVSLSVTGSDVDGDALTYTWTQVSGTSVDVGTITNTLNFTAPDVNDDETLSFTVVARDNLSLSAPQTFTVRVENKKSGGSFEWFLMLLVLVTGISRRRIR